MSLKTELINTAKRAQISSRQLSLLPAAVKNKILRQMAVCLLREKRIILAANKKDMSLALKVKMAPAFIDRLSLNEKRIQEMADAFLELAKLPDPVGEVMRSIRRPNGLKINKVRTPIGVIMIIYESRPNVTAECIGLCFKSGNSVILRGGSESLNTNQAIYKVLQKTLKANGISEGAVNLVTTADRSAIDILLKFTDYIDLVIPRGGEGLIRRVARVSRIPVVKHYKGICHVYVDKSADLDMAENICFNAKVQRPGVCNAMESMLVHKDIAKRFLPRMFARFVSAGVEMRGCDTTRNIIKGKVKKATERDYYSEYLGLILSVKVVSDLDSAIRHINHYGSHHSDSIVTRDKSSAAKFLKGVDSACVYVNASTRFTDGFQFGLGAEIGISTDKIHARGPMALEELTTYKYEVYGSGQVRR